MRGASKDGVWRHAKPVKTPKSQQRDPATGGTLKPFYPLDQESVNLLFHGDQRQTTTLTILDNDFPGDEIRLAAPQEVVYKLVKL